MFKFILVTGGAGFIGSNFVPYFCRKYPNYYILNLDKLTYAGHLDNLIDCNQLPNYRFVLGDICDSNLINRLFNEYDIQGVIHFAAESHVDNSIKNPTPFMHTNIIGTFNLLENAYHHWMNGPQQVKSGYENCRFHHISTDEVFGALGQTGFFTENTPYSPTNPYSASKAGADFIVQSYHRTFGLNTTISNCSNNYGPKQHHEKLIPHMISCALSEKALPIHGNGQNIRDWIYVLDHCKAVDLIFHKGINGQSYNISAHNEQTNKTVVEKICMILDQKKPRPNNEKYAELITFIQDRPGHDFRYALNAQKLINTLNWHPDETFDDALEKTIDWYLKNTLSTKA